MFTDPYFRMTVADVFTIRGQDIVVTGQIESGTVGVGHEVYVHGSDSDSVKTAVITSIEKHRRKHQQAQAGDACGLILAGVNKEDVQRGDVLLGQDGR